MYCFSKTQLFFFVSSSSPFSPFFIRICQIVVTDSKIATFYNIFASRIIITIKNIKLYPYGLLLFLLGIFSIYYTNKKGSSSKFFFYCHLSFFQLVTNEFSKNTNKSIMVTPRFFHFSHFFKNPKVSGRFKNGQK